MHELFRTKQGNRPWQEYFAEIETKAQLLEFDTIPYTHKDAVKHAMTMGMSDRILMERVLTEDPNHDTFMRWGHVRELGKAGVSSLTGHSATNRVETLDTEMSETEIEDLIETLSVMKVRKQGKYSGRPKRETPRPQNCRNCRSDHPSGRCPANGKECYDCGGYNHFAKSETCPRNRRSVRRMQNDTYDSEGSYGYATTAMNHEDVRMISTVGRLETSYKTKEVTIKIGGVPQTLFTDTGSDKTIIPPSHYTKGMGQLVATDTRLRAWGSDKLLDVKGMIHAKLETEKGATAHTKVYVVNGYQPEPLLGDADAEALGFVIFNKEGREPTQEEQRATVNRNHCIPEKVRQGLNVQVVTNRPQKPEISKEWQKEPTS